MSDMANSNDETGATGDPSVDGRWRRAFLRVVLVLGSAFVALLLAEIGLPLFIPVTDAPLQFWDPVVGTRHLPDMEGRWISGEHINSPYRFNSQGWNHPRDYSTVKPPGTKRVCVIGDSFTQALDVPLEQTFFVIARERMSRPDRPVEWYTFANGGYGTAEEYMLLRHYALDYDPDTVVILFVQNDLADTSPYLAYQPPTQARATLGETGELILIPPRLRRMSPVRGWLAKSALVRYLYLQRQFFHAIPDMEAERKRIAESYRQAGGGGKASSPPEAVAADLQRRSWELIEAILRRAQRDCCQQGILLALAYRGSRSEIEAAERGERYTPPPSEVDPYCVGQRRDEMGKDFLEPITDRLGIPYLDLTPALIAKVKGTGRHHVIPGNLHWNDVGHAAAGEALAAWIESLWRDQEQSPANP